MRLTITLLAVFALVAVALGAGTNDQCVCVCNRDPAAIRARGEVMAQNLVQRLDKMSTCNGDFCFENVDAGFTRPQSTGSLSSYIRMVQDAVVDFFKN